MLAIIRYTTTNKLLLATGPDAKTMKRIRTLWTMGPIIYLAAILHHSSAPKQASPSTLQH
ncbi:MAG TPA: hypothetical protein VFE98_05390 [Candidatus Bathyarchaeia archaeon]|nr:hypothetical protein [Candidatus Bathyarchaeia archaeon]